MRPTGMRLGLSLLLAVATALFMSGCGERPPPDQGSKITLEPPDQRPVHSIQVGDAAEIALLQQERKLELLRRDGSTLYFYGNPELNKRLHALGYEPEPANPYRVFQRVLRVARHGDENALAAAGLRIVNREEDHWVVQGPIANLRTLQQAGYRLTPVGPHGPRPRQVSIRLPSRGAIGQLRGVDVYSVIEVEDGVVVHGAAFDFQIDSLRARGYTVDVSGQTKGGEKP